MRGDRPEQGVTAGATPAAASDADRLAAIRVVERWLEAFDRRWPEPEELDELVTDDVELVERPNLVSPHGGRRDHAAMLAGVEAGRALLAWQSYEVGRHVVEGDEVVTTFRWEGELAIDVGAWTAGTRLGAWCCAAYRLRDGRIARIEQYDCYDPLP